MKRTLIIAIAIFTLSTLLTSCSDNFTCTFSGNVEFRHTENSAAIPINELESPMITLYNEAGDVIATTTEFTDNTYSFTVDLPEGVYKLVASATEHAANNRSFKLYATTGMFYLIKGTSSYENDFLVLRM